MAGRLIGNGSGKTSTVASPSANRRTIERRVGSDKAAKTTSNRSGAVTVIVAVPPADTSQIGYLTDWLHIVKGPWVSIRYLDPRAVVEVCGQGVLLVRAVRVGRVPQQ